MRICVFGSSSRDLDALYIDAAYELGRTLAEHGHGLVFGGYDVGLMARWRMASAMRAAAS